MKMNYITVHCSATRPTQDFHAADIDRWHKERGWAEIGYHFVVALDGTIELGRPTTKTGAHVGGHNTGNIGICMIGGLDEIGSPWNTFNEKQYASLQYLITDLVSIHGIKQENILGHRDWKGVTKSCPCFDVKTWLESLL